MQISQQCDVRELPCSSACCRCGSNTSFTCFTAARHLTNARVHQRQSTRSTLAVFASRTKRTFCRSALCRSVSIVSCSRVQTMHGIWQAVASKLGFVLAQPSHMLLSELCCYLRVRVLVCMHHRGLLVWRECAHVLDRTRAIPPMAHCMAAHIWTTNALVQNCFTCKLRRCMRTMQHDHQSCVYV